MFLIRPDKKNGNHGEKRRLGFEHRLLWSVLLTGFPAILLSLLLLWSNSYSLDHKLELTAVLLLLWLGLSVSARDKVVHSVQVLSNVVAAVKHEDFSFRAKEALAGDAFGELAIEINNLARTLEEERLGSKEAASLLRAVMSEAGAAIFAFSPDRRLRFVNRTGEAFLGGSEEQFAGRTADELGIADLLGPSLVNIISRPVSGIERRWIVRRTQFRQRGVPHQLILLSEASEALRAEERLAWQRIIRVLGHEINNSLAPIKSIAHTLARQSVNLSLPKREAEDFLQGLNVINERAESLNHFLQSYTRLAKLPPPVKRVVFMDTLIAHVISIEARLRVNVIPGPSIYVNVDPDQIEQVFINLIKNSVEAVLAVEEGRTGADPVTVSWKTTRSDLEVFIRDQGIGLLDVENLFVPFYTTKQSGTGIGLILSRQIIEAHGGVLTLRNRSDERGCEVHLKLPSCVLSFEAAASRLQSMSNS